MTTLIYAVKPYHEPSITKILKTPITSENIVGIFKQVMAFKCQAVKHLETQLELSTVTQELDKPETPKEPLIHLAINSCSIPIIQ